MRPFFAFTETMETFFSLLTKSQIFFSRLQTFGCSPKNYLESHDKEFKLLLVSEIFPDFIHRIYDADTNLTQIILIWLCYRFCASPPRSVMLNGNSNFLFSIFFSSFQSFFFTIERTYFSRRTTEVTRPVSGYWNSHTTKNINFFSVSEIRFWSNCGWTSDPNGCRHKTECERSQGNRIASRFDEYFSFWFVSCWKKSLSGENEGR